MISADPNQRRWAKRFASRCGLTFGIGWAVGGFLVLLSSYFLFADQGLVLNGRLPLPGKGDLHEGTYWLMMWCGYLIFPFSNFSLILFFLIFAWLFGRDDLRFWLVSVTAIVWMTVALFVDCLMLAASFKVGLIHYSAENLSAINETMKFYNHTVLDVLRWPVRGMYLFMGLNFLAFARLTSKQSWPRTVVWSSAFIGIMFLVEVLTFGITSFFGSSPIHVPAFMVTFFVAAPWWGIGMAWAVRDRGDSLH